MLVGGVKFVELSMLVVADNHRFNSGRRLLYSTRLQHLCSAASQLTWKLCIDTYLIWRSQDIGSRCQLCIFTGNEVSCKVKVERALLFVNIRLSKLLSDSCHRIITEVIIIHREPCICVSV